MKPLLLAFAVVAGLGWSQTPGPAATQAPGAGVTTPPKPALPSSVKPGGGQHGSAVRTLSYKDLRFPPLPQLKIPDVATFTLPNGMRLYLTREPRASAGARHGPGAHRQSVRSER